MHYNLDEFIDEYDELARSVEAADNQYFQTRLKQWLALLDTGDGDIADHVKWLAGLLTWEQIESTIVLPPSGMLGSGKINFPETVNERLSVNLQLFRRLANGQIDPINFGLNYAYTKSNNVNDIIHTMLSQIFGPFVSELRRYIRRNFDEPVPDNNHSQTSSPIPAADRIVTINHNSSEYHKIDDNLSSLESSIAAVNDYDDPEDKEQRIAEIGAGRRLLQSIRVRADALVSVLHNVLTYIAKKFADNWIGAVATTTLALIGKATGLW